MFGDKSARASSVRGPGWDSEGGATGGFGQTLTQNQQIGVDRSEQRWYAIQTLARHEKKVSLELQRRGIHSYLPLVTETHRWTDRKKDVELPLFSTYAFVKIVRTPESRLEVLKVNGVLNFIGDRRLGEPIPDSQIESIRTLLDSDLPFSEHAFFDSRTESPDSRRCPEWNGRHTDGC